MKARIIFLLFIGILLVPLYSLAQYQGTYTVGDNIADFGTLDSAMYAFQDSSRTGQIVLKMKPGEYDRGSINLDSITLEPESADTLDVIFTDGFNLSGKSVILNRLIIRSIKTERNSSTLYISQADSIIVRNCEISTSISSTTHSAACITLNYSKSDDAPTLLENNILTGSGYGIDFNGSGGLICVGNKVLNTGYSSFENEYKSTIINLSNNLFLGFVRLNGSLNANYTFNGNVLYGEVRIDDVNVVENCQFRDTLGRQYSDAWLGYPTIISNNYIGKTFTITSTGNTRKLSGNHFDGKGNISGYSYLSVTENIAYDRLSINGNASASIRNNKLFGGLAVGYYIKASVFNNILGGRLGSNSSIIIYNNNFMPSADLGYLSGNAIAYNNLFPSTVDLGGFGKVFSHNNYFPNGGNRDIHPYNIDPMLDSYGKATNPALAGIGININNNVLDRDSNIRAYLPTIGTHEICSTQPYNGRTEEITCGERYLISACNHAENTHWEPAEQIDVLAADQHYFAPKSNQVFHLYDTANYVIDSIRFVVGEFEPFSILSDSSSCYESTFISLGYTPTANYTWTPTTALYDSTYHFTFRSWIDSTTTYVYSIEIPGCDTIVDSVTYYVDPKPVLNNPFRMTQFDIASYSFNAYYYCIDSVRWHFGDGDTAHDNSGHAWHEYALDKDSVYYGFVVGYNLSATDTTFFTVDARPVNINEVAISNFVKFYPNPANDNLTIETDNQVLSDNVTATIYDTMGQTVEHFKINQSITSVALSKFKSGIYYIQLSSSFGSTTTKIVVAK